MTLFKQGIRGLVQMAGDTAAFMPQKDCYINKCDLCTEVRSFLVQHNYQGSDELKPVEFYFRT